MCSYYDVTTDLTGLKLLLDKTAPTKWQKLLSEHSINTRSNTWSTAQTLEPKLSGKLTQRSKDGKKTTKNGQAEQDNEVVKDDGELVRAMEKDATNDMI